MLMALRVTEIHGAVETDSHGNVSAFVTVDSGERALLRKRPPFPSVGEEVPGYALVKKTAKSGKEYWKLEKPQEARGGGSRGQRKDGPDEAYWEGQNAAKSRSASQDRAVRAWALGFRPPGAPNGPATLENLSLLIDWFTADVATARDRAVEGASAHTGGQAPQGSPASGGATGRALPEPNSDVASPGQVSLMDVRRKKAGVTDQALAVVLGQFGVSRLEDMPRERVDEFLRAIGEPVPTGEPDVPAEWPEPVAAASDDADIPFRARPIPDREHVRRDLFTGDRWVA